MKRGDLLTVAIPGDYGKPHPAVVVQTDMVAHTDSILVCMVTSEHAPSSIYRVPIPANQGTGLRKPSQIMADKTMTYARAKCGPVFGRISDAELTQLGEALIFIFGLGTS